METVTFLQSHVVSYAVYEQNSILTRTKNDRVPQIILYSE